MSTDGECPKCGRENVWKECSTARGGCGWNKWQIEVELDEGPLIVPDESQEGALRRILDWFENPTSYLTLGGYAGTGKTTIIRELIRRLGERGIRGIAVCAFTGKAASVLRSKGIKSAKTIHSTIKQPETFCDACGSTIVAGPCTVTPQCLTAKTYVDFIPAPILEADLVIVDEASMVSTALHEDLLAYDVPTLYVGDHGQLEPVGKNPQLMKDPQIKLEQIHRQAEDSAIIQFAHHVRQHREPVTMGSDATVIYTGHVPKNAHEFDIVIVGTNLIRVAVNRMIRRNRGYSGDLPIPGERVICLRNEKKYNVFNGMLATVLEIRCDENVDKPEMDIVDDDGDVHRCVPFYPEQFNEEDTLDVSKKYCLFDFGYALTCHKSQGSAWDRVLVCERIPHPDTSVARWRYTAATRAKKELVWCMPEPRRGRGRG